MWSRLDRLRRRAGWDRNPLRRPSDRLQSAVTLLLGLAFLATAAAGSFLGCGAVYRAGAHAEQVRRAEIHQVTASFAPPSSGAGPAGSVYWTGRDGRVHGAARTFAVTDLGGRTTIWVDLADRPALAPPSHAQTITNTILVGLGITLGAACAYAGLGTMAGRLLDRRRYLTWDREWARADRRWRRSDQS